MIDLLTNAIKSHAAPLDQATGQVKYGTVTSVNAQSGMARVMIQPDAVLSGWLPVLTQWVGNGWGMVCPPSPGDQVLLVPQEGDIEQAIIIGRTFSRQSMPPVAPVGEFWLVHQSGSSLKLCNDGTIRVTGDLHVAGDVYDRVGPLSQLRTHYNEHTHSAGIIPATSPPNPQDM
jgi:phage baseplate assembly protein V